MRLSIPTYLNLTLNLIQILDREREMHDTRSLAPASTSTSDEICLQPPGLFSSSQKGSSRQLHSKDTKQMRAGIITPSISEDIVYIKTAASKERASPAPNMVTFEALQTSSATQLMNFLPSLSQAGQHCW